MKPRFETSNHMYMLGLRAQHTYDTPPLEITKQWNRLQKFLPLANQMSDESYGIIINNHAEFGKYEYMCALEVEDLDNIPECLESLVLKIQRCAVFTIDSWLDDNFESWKWIINEWLPQSTYDAANAPFFEKYIDGARNNRTGAIELWVPIAPDRD